MKDLIRISLLFLLAGCTNEELSYVSIRNDTDIPIYALPYSAEYTEGEWIEPGVTDEFYSIKCDCLDGFEYFSFYYDSLIVYLKDLDEHPVKFFKNGKTINYDPTLNPFTNPDVWRSRILNGADHNLIQEHYFPIKAKYVKSLGDTLNFRLNPSS
jgi:hypothetical protein